MGFFFPEPKKQPSSQPPSKAEQFFQRQGGKIHISRFNYHLNRVALPAYKRQHFEDIIQKHNLENRDWFKRSYISKEEFFKALDEAAKDPRDSLTKEDAEIIKRTFS